MAEISLLGCNPPLMFPPNVSEKCLDSLPSLFCCYKTPRHRMHTGKCNLGKLKSELLVACGQTFWLQNKPSSIPLESRAFAWTQLTEPPCLLLRTQMVKFLPHFHFRLPLPRLFPRKSGYLVSVLCHSQRLTLWPSTSPAW